MGKTISFGIQKGGVGKTTTTAISAYLLSQEYRVLAIDFDSQGNLTQFLTGKDIYDFTGRTVLQAVQEQDPRPYIHVIHDNLHLLPAEDFLSGLGMWLHRVYNGDYRTALKTALSLVKDQYDYILIDLPPNLGEQTTNGLAASDEAVVMLQCEPFCYNALDRYIEFVLAVKQELNPELSIAGILPTMLDARATVDNAVLADVRAEYEEFVFDTVIRRKARIKEFSSLGIQTSTKADREALESHESFIKELVTRVQGRQFA